MKLLDDIKTWWGAEEQQEKEHEEVVDEIATFAKTIGSMVEEMKDGPHRDNEHNIRRNIY